MGRVPAAKEWPQGVPHRSRRESFTRGACDFHAEWMISALQDRGRACRELRWNAQDRGFTRAVVRFDRARYFPHAGGVLKRTLVIRNWSKRHRFTVDAP